MTPKERSKRNWYVPVQIGLIALAVVLTVRLGLFMFNPARVSASVIPQSPFVVEHSCLTAYIEGARLSATTPNLYDEALYGGHFDASLPHGGLRMLGPFTVDPFMYPPPFLLLPRLALSFTHNFLTLHAAWFVLDVAIVLAALLLTASWVGGRDRRIATLLVPLVWISMTTMMSLQMGNFGPAAVALAMLAMVALEQQRPKLGGALLAFVALSKVFPGLLVLYLAVQRRWRDLAWTAAFAAIYIVLALVVFGTAPFVSFFRYDLPRIDSGAAFPLDPGGHNQFPIAVNQSISGIVLKLSLFGVTGVSVALARVVSWIYTAALVLVVITAARKERDRLGLARIWLALLVLGQMRSPFFPDDFAALWLLSLIVPDVRRDARSIALVVGAWFTLAYLMVPPVVDMRWLAAVSLMQIALVVGLCLWCITGHRRTRNPARKEDLEGVAAA